MSSAYPPAITAVTVSPRPDHSSAGVLPPQKAITYRDLIEHHLDGLRTRLRAEAAGGEEADPAGDDGGETVEKQVQNHLTALKAWMSWKGLSQGSTVGGEFAGNFGGELERHRAYLKVKLHNRRGKAVKGLAESTIKNRLSILGQWRASWKEMAASADGALKGRRSILEALKYLVERSGKTPWGFARAVGVPAKTFRLWYLGEINPSGREETVEAFRAMERYGGLKDGELTSLIKPTFGVHQLTGAELPRSKFALRQQRATSEKYTLSQFPPRLQAEFDGWFDLMTAPLEPDDFRRNGCWFVDPEIHECSTAVRYKLSLASFFGYLCLPVEGRRFPVPKRKKGGAIKAEEAEVEYTVVCGEGFNQDCLTLALMGDVALVRRYLEFMRKRAGGSYNQDTTHFLDTCCALLRKETGYVRQHPEYGERLPSPVANRRWNKWCDSAHARFRKLIQELKKNGHVTQTRDVEEPIDFILRDAHPVRYLYKLADSVEENLPPESAAKYQRAMAYRDMFLVRFLTANPLRIKHFAQMTWRTDNTGNLYRREDGSWWLRFPKEVFKNRRSLKKKYEAMLPPSLWTYVGTYLVKYRPLLLGALNCDYVFRPGPRGGSFKHKTGDSEPMLASSLSKILRNYARKLLNCMGFGPHAYRHIVATDYLKNNPDGLRIAASILHDRPETILKYYGHAQHSDYFRHWIDYHEAQLAAYRAGITEVAA